MAENVIAKINLPTNVEYTIKDNSGDKSNHQHDGGDIVSGTVSASYLPAMTGATSSAAGTAGLVPAPTANDATKFLCGNGSWEEVSSGSVPDFTGATSSTAGVHGLVPAPATGDQEKFLSGGGTWNTITIPIATSSTVGSVKPSTGLSINAQGSLSVSITSIIPVSFIASDWVEDSTNGWKIQTVTTYTDGNIVSSLTPTLRSAAAIAVDLDMSSATITTAPTLQNAWALVGRVYSDNSGLHAICYGDAPTVTLPLNLYVTMG